MDFFNTIEEADFVVGEEHATTAKNEAKTNKGETGIYLVRITTSNGKSVSSKLIIE